MSPASSCRLPLAAVALLLLPLAARPARALPEAPPPLPSQNESPDELEARVHYEKALRAEMDSRLDEADREAKATADAAAAAKSERYSEAARRLQERLAARRAKGEPGETGQGDSTGIGSRVEFVGTATATGIYLSGLLGATAAPDNGKAITGILMLGGVGSLVGSLLATRNVRVGSSWGTTLMLGTVYAQGAYFLAGAASGAKNFSTGGFLATGALGAALGLGTAILLPVSGGDSGALWTGAVYGALLPSLITAAATIETADNGRTLAAVALVGGTVGMLGLGVANRSLNWSRGRWNIISLGGSVGFLVGLGMSYLTSANDTSIPGVFIWWTAGTALGLGMTAWLTDGWTGDERRVAANALFDYRPGQGVGIGNALTAVVPLPGVEGRSGGLAARLFEARW
jgi:hypothetical protein